MIEFIEKNTPYSKDWMTLHPTFSSLDEVSNYRKYNFKINRIVYTERTKEFERAFEIEALWQLLQIEVDL